jgi:hypothetical protein
MIDFRYHLISIIAVFLALAIGVVLGSAIFGSPLIQSLRNHVDAIRQTNADVRQQNSTLRLTLAADRRFAETIEPQLIKGALNGKTVVVLDAAGTSSTLVGSLTDEVTAAGGTVSTTIDLTDKFALTNGPDRDQLGLILNIAPKKTSTLRARAGQIMGSRMGGSANPSGRGGLAGDLKPESRSNSLLADLAKAGFVDIHVFGTGTSTVPAGSVFLIVAGDPAQPPFNTSNLLSPMVGELANQRVIITVAGPTDSSWGLIEALRGDPRTSARVSTVDDAESVPGRIATALSLARSATQPGGAYGLGGDVLPTPSPITP